MAVLTQSESISAAILYGDIFHYPLTKKELWRWAIGQRVSHSTVSLYAAGESEQSLFFLRTKRSQIAKRLVRFQAANSKWQLARNISWWIALIPTVQLVGVTGGLARNNADPDDDIDLCIVTNNHVLWVTRLMVTIVVELVGRRRRPSDTQVVDAICLNLFFSLKGMAIPSSHQNLYVAYEVMQMVPVFDRGDVYKNFLGKNKWVENYLPNAWSERQTEFSLVSKRKESIFYSVMGSIFYLLCIFVEPLTQFIQLRYMRSRRTNETITAENIAFHPKDVTNYVKKALFVRGKRYRLPLDKVFVLQLK